MRIRIYDIITNETIYQGRAKNTDTFDSVLNKAGKLDIKADPKRNYRSRQTGKYHSYYNLACEVL